MNGNLLLKNDKNTYYFIIIINIGISIIAHTESTNDCAYRYNVHNYYLRNLQDAHLIFIALQVESEDRTGGVITLDENSMDNSMEKMDMLDRQEIIMEEEVTNGDSSDGRNRLIDFGEVMGMEESAEILQSQGNPSVNNSVEIGIETMELDESGREVRMVVDTVQSTDEVKHSEDVADDASTEIPRASDENVEASEENAEKIEPDTEAVSEDEFPTEAAAKVETSEFLRKFAECLIR